MSSYHSVYLIVVKCAHPILISPLFVSDFVNIENYIICQSPDKKKHNEIIRAMTSRRIRLRGKWRQSAVINPVSELSSVRLHTSQRVYDDVRGAHCLPPNSIHIQLFRMSKTYLTF